jgi:hypothetical protein
LVEHGKWTPLSWCLASLITSLFLSLFDRCCLSLANNMPTMKSVVRWLPSVETTSVSPCGPRLANATQLWNPLGKWSTHFIDRGRSHWFAFFFFCYHSNKIRELLNLPMLLTMDFIPHESAQVHEKFTL